MSAIDDRPDTDRRPFSSSGRFQVYREHTGHWAFRLRDATGSLLAFSALRSEPFRTPEEAAAGCEEARRAAIGASIGEARPGCATRCDKEPEEE